MNIDISVFLQESNKKLPVFYQRVLEALLRDNSEENWNYSFFITLDGKISLWEYVSKVDKSIPFGCLTFRGGKIIWKNIPSQDTIRHAMLLAQDHVLAGINLKR